MKTKKELSPKRVLMKEKIRRSACRYNYFFFKLNYSCSNHLIEICVVYRPHIKGCTMYECSIDWMFYWLNAISIELWLWCTSIFLLNFVTRIRVRCMPYRLAMISKIVCKKFLNYKLTKSDSVVGFCSSSYFSLCDDSLEF